MKRKLYFLLVLFACCLLSITQAKPECNEYKCSFLDCEPFSIQTTILVRDTLSIFSNSEKICKGSTGFFYTNTSGKVRWEIYDSNNSLIYSGKSDTLSYTFDISDSYKITASGARTTSLAFVIRYAFLSDSLIFLKLQTLDCAVICKLHKSATIKDKVLINNRYNLLYILLIKESRTMIGYS